MYNDYPIREARVLANYAVEYTATYVLLAIWTLHYVPSKLQPTLYIVYTVHKLHVHVY